MRRLPVLHANALRIEPDDRRTRRAAVPPTTAALRPSGAGGATTRSRRRSGSLSPRFGRLARRQRVRQHASARHGAEPSTTSRQPANFDISESLIAYRAGDPYAARSWSACSTRSNWRSSGCALATRARRRAWASLRAAGNPLLSRLVGRLCRNRPQHAAGAAAVLLDRARPRAAAGAAGAGAAAPRLSFGARRLSAMAHGRRRRDLADRRAVRRAGRSSSVSSTSGWRGRCARRNGCSSLALAVVLPVAWIRLRRRSASRSTRRRSRASTSSAASA